MYIIGIPLSNMSGNISEEHTETGDNKKSLPGNDHDVDDPSSARGGIGNIIVG